jgi:kynureninase
MEGEASELDAADELRNVRERFVLPEDGTIYLDGACSAATDRCRGWSGSPLDCDVLVPASAV